MISFKTPDIAGDEDILGRQLLNEGHTNSATIMWHLAQETFTGQPGFLAERILHALLGAAEEIRAARISRGECISL